MKPVTERDALQKSKSEQTFVRDAQKKKRRAEAREERVKRLKAQIEAGPAVV